MAIRERRGTEREKWGREAAGNRRRRRATAVFAGGRGPEVFADRRSRCLAADRLDVGAHVALRAGGEIVAYADRADADLIVVGAHGRSGVERLLLGSVTENVIRRTDRPVHVVRVEDGETGQ